MTVDKQRKRAARDLAAREGVISSTAALRRLPGPVTWVLLDLANGAQGPGVDGFHSGDVIAIAYGAARVRAWRRRAPDVMLYPLPEGARQFLVELAYADRGDAPSDVAAKLDEGVRHELFMRTGRRWRVQARETSGDELETLHAQAAPGIAGPPIAARAWHRRAIVRLLQDHTLTSPYTDPGPPRRAGEMLRLWQTGRAGEPVDDSKWHTGGGADDIAFVPDNKVQVLELLEDVPPHPDPAAPTRAELVARRWQRAHAWATEALADPATDPADLEALLDDRAQAIRDIKAALPRRRLRLAGDPEPGPLNPREIRPLLQAALEAMEQIGPPGRATQTQRAALADDIAAVRTALDNGAPAALAEAADHLAREDDTGLSAPLGMDVDTALPLAEARTGQRWPKYDPHTPGALRLGERIAAQSTLAWT